MLEVWLSFLSFPSSSCSKTIFFWVKSYYEMTLVPSLRKKASDTFRHICYFRNTLKSIKVKFWGCSFFILSSCSSIFIIWVVSCHLLRLALGAQVLYVFISACCLQDLSKLNRDPSRILYVSGHCIESTLQPENCVSIKPWKLENDDTALLDLLPFLECEQHFKHNSSI